MTAHCKFWQSGLVSKGWPSVVDEFSNKKGDKENITMHPKHVSKLG